MLEIHQFLISAGYRPLTAANNIVENAIIRAFKLLGEPCYDLLVNHLCAMHRLPRHILLTRYDLISVAIRQVFGYGSEVFLHEIRESLLESLPHLDRSLGTARIVEETHKFEVLKFAGDLRRGRVILLCSNYSSRQQVLDAFFQRTTAAGTRMQHRLAEARYDDGENVVAGARAYCNLVSCQHSPVKQQEEHASARVFLCTHNIDESEVDLYDAVLSHDHVVTDRPFMVYSRTGVPSTLNNREHN
ncbi:hypothetical protein [Nitrososphaera sp.]|uniref:hypothetical protein n=1 Tax=Nitrososphaera sp. TaxID=1971748 RepID=UPI00317BA692